MPDYTHTHILHRSAALVYFAGSTKVNNFNKTDMHDGLNLIYIVYNYIYSDSVPELDDTHLDKTLSQLVG